MVRQENIVHKMRCAVFMSVVGVNFFYFGLESSNRWQANLVKPQAVIASASYASHRGKTEDRRRFAAYLCVEERKRPSEDVVCKGFIESVFNALQRNQSAGSREA